MFKKLFRSSPEKTLKKHGERATNRRAQAPDRWQSLQTVGEVGSREAVEILLRRFLFRCDPTITDQEEKELAFGYIVRSGDLAVEPTIRFLHEQNALAWAVKVLRSVSNEKVIIEELLAELDSMDTEYERDPQKKIQTLSVLGDFQSESIPQAVRPFVGDMNDAVRFAAITSLFAQSSFGEEDKEALLSLFADEESVRNKCVILEGFAAKDIKIPTDLGALPEGFRIEKDGSVHAPAR